MKLLVLFLALVGFALSQNYVEFSQTYQEVISKENARVRITFNDDKSEVYIAANQLLAKFNAVTMQYTSLTDQYLFREANVSPKSLTYVPASSPYLFTPANPKFYTYNTSLVRGEQFGFNPNSNSINTIYQSVSNTHTILACESIQLAKAYNFTVVRYTLDTDGKYVSRNVISSNTEQPSPLAAYQCKKIAHDSVTGETYFLSGGEVKNYISAVFISDKVNVYTASGSIIQFTKDPTASLEYFAIDLEVHNNVVFMAAWVIADPLPKFLTILRYSRSAPSIVEKTAIIAGATPFEAVFSIAYDGTKSRLFAAIPNGLIMVFDSDLNNIRNITLYTGKTTYHDSIILNPSLGLGFVTVSFRSLDFNFDTDKVALARFSMGDCGRFSTCSSCKAAEYCGWCYFQNACAAKGLCNSKPGFIEGSGVCDAPVGTSSPSSIYQEESTPIEVTASNVFYDPAEISEAVNYTCRFSNGIITLGTFISKSSVNCSTINLTSSTLSQNLTFSIYLNNALFNGPYSVELINCNSVVSCLECKSIPQKCDWCDTSSSCASEGSSCSSFASTCPFPQILSLSQNRSPASGGILLEIEMANFDSSLQEVLVAGVNCSSPIYDSNTSKVKCTLGSNSPTVGTVSIFFTNFGWINSTSQFEFVNDPQIIDFTPSWGFIFGNTTITVKGDYFDTTSFSLTLEGKNFCDVESSNKTTIICNTISGSATSGKLRISMANAISESSSSFTFFSPPSITSISPKTSPASGGIQLNITGTGFLISDVSITVGGAKCVVTSIVDTQISCVAESSSPVSNQVISLRMAGYVFSSSGQNTFSYVEDPTITSFSPTSSGKLDNSRIISIIGKNLGSGPVTVTVANCTCDIKTASDSSIICQLQEGCQGTGAIQVSIGNAKAISNQNFTYEPAPPPTDAPTDAPTNTPTPVPTDQSQNDKGNVVGPVVGSILGLLFIVLIIVAFLFYRHKRKTLKVKQRKKVKDVSAIIFAGYKDSGVDLSDKTLSSLEASLDELLICDNFEIYKFLNEGPDSEIVMKAVGLYIFEKSYISPVFEYFCQREVDTAENEKRLFRGPDVCSRLFRSILKPISFNMYWDLLGPVFDLVMESTIVQTGEKMTKATSQIEMMNQKDVEAFELNIYKLQLVAHQLVAAVMKSKEQMPMSLREILMTVGRNVNEKFGHDARDHALITFFILRFLSAILMTPKNHNILKDEQKQIPESASTTLTNLSSIIVKIASGKEFIEQDGKLAEMNPFIKSHVQKFERFFEELMNSSDVANEPNACDSLPKYVKQVVVAEIVNSLIKAKDRIDKIEDIQTKTKLQEFLEANPKPVSYSNKNFAFGQIQ